MLTWPVPSPNFEIQNRSYYYTRAGDIEEIDDAVSGIEYNYTYDDLHRLTGETNTGPEAPIYYTYNAIGNMMSRTAGADAFTYTYDPARPHAVSSMDLNGTPYSYTYDTNGNMTAGKDFTDPANPTLRSLTWNADNMPVSVSRGGVTTSFKYDGLGQRAKKQVGSASPTYYIGTEYEVIAGTDTKYIFAGNLRIAKVSSTGVYYFHKDHLGSSTVMTGDTGTVVETSEYRPYGSFRSQSGTEVSDYKFTDQELDTSTGLYNYDARLYDPVIGRFISADPTVPRPFDPQSLNRYSYCRNNPLIYIDPSGLEDEGWGGSDGSWGGYDSDVDESGYGIAEAHEGFNSDGSIAKPSWNRDYRDVQGNPISVGPTQATDPVRVTGASLADVHGKAYAVIDYDKNGKAWTDMHPLEKNADGTYTTTYADLGRATLTIAQPRPRTPPDWGIEEYQAIAFGKAAGGGVLVGVGYISLRPDLMSLGLLIAAEGLYTLISDEEASLPPFI